MTSAVHQFTTKLEPGAVGNHVLLLQEVLRGAGIESEVFALETDPQWKDRSRPVSDYGGTVPARASDVLVYQYAIGSPLADLIRQFPGSIVVNSHTQTPPELLDRWDPEAAYGVAWGMRQLAELGPVSRLGIAVSEHNAIEMRNAGFGDVVVAPVLARMSIDTPVPADAPGWPCTGTRWLFVGRIAPNKRQDDIIRALAWYRRAYDVDAGLTLVGSGGDSRYGRALRRFVDSLDLGAAVTFSGPVDDAALAAYYGSADVFVCLSEHEGFCVPLVEAMRVGLPIVARATSAIPETLGDAGLLLDGRRPSVVAAAVRRMVTDADLRLAYVAHGTRRAGDFAANVVGKAYLAALEPVLS